VIDRFFGFGRGKGIVGIEMRECEREKERERERKRERERGGGRKNHLPWGRGVGAWDRLAAPGERVHIHYMGVGHHRRYPSTGRRDRFL